MDNFKYIKQPVRRISTEAMAGDLVIGGKNPVRLQSMTSTNTMDTEATVRQCVRIGEAGADLVRITAPNVRAAENFKNIRKQLRDEGCDIPLAADIHYSPKAAKIAALYADKLRINPGNFVDSKKFSNKLLSDSEYRQELQRIREIFIPFLDVCKQYKRSIRIGVNHGSLSDRIMSRCGDTVKGMTESAMEYLRICRDEGFDAVVLSMKANNPLIMIEANRALVKAMQDEGMNFPVHIGVTEAGEGEDGRIKSAVGIAALLADGIGETIRVSLTEEPEAEISAAKTLRDLFDLAFSENFSPPTVKHQKRQAKTLSIFGGENKPAVIADLRRNQLSISALESAGFRYNTEQDCFEKTDTSADVIFVSKPDLPAPLPEGIIAASSQASFTGARVMGLSEFLQNPKADKELVFLELSPEEFKEISPEQLAGSSVILTARLSKSNLPLHAGREIIELLKGKAIDNPLVLNMELDRDEKEKTLKFAAILGGLSADYGTQGIMASDKTGYSAQYNTVCFGILQAVGLRITKPDYISCPSCGRTLFDIQKTVAAVRKKTAHLRGVKIAVMGCTVNGLGEMADADYGYIGAGKGKINLYKNKNLYKKNISEENAVEELLALIESNL